MIANEEYKQKEKIPADKIEFINIIGEGNCLFRIFFYHIYSNEDH